MALDYKKEETVAGKTDLDLPVTDPNPTRRTFLKWGIIGLGGALTVAVGAPIALYVIDPALKGNAGGETLVELGPIADFVSANAPKPVAKSFEYKDAFKTEKREKTVFVRALNGNPTSEKDFQILDSICTHAGCAVSYNSPIAPATAKDKFYCPCHQSIFNQDGTVVQVAPRPLHTYKTYVRDGKVFFNALEPTA
jgi:menaquinol-cytochrome c reductase iron-sulfur subunit